MADSDALRAKRSRWHNSGNHSLCHPERCKVLRAAGGDDDEGSAFRPGRPAELGTRGRDLWDAVTKDGLLGPMQSVLLLEACRIADRLDTLDRQLHGEAWLRFRHDESGAEVTVYVDRVLAEAREQATALKGLYAELQKTMGAKKPSSEKGGGKLASVLALVPTSAG